MSGWQTTARNLGLLVTIWLVVACAAAVGSTAIRATSEPSSVVIVNAAPAPQKPKPVAREPRRLRRLSR